jgi:glycosyltransferase involved in cell wall biosynthesis
VFLNLRKGNIPVKIAQISTPTLRTPPERYGGIEAVVSTLTEQLVALGHDVTLFATGDSITQGQLWSWFEKPTHNINFADELLHMVNAYEYISKADFDIVHNHTLIVGPALLSLSSTPSVTTLHITQETLPAMDFRSFYGAISSRHSFIALSKSQQTQMPWLNWIGQVPNAVNVADFSFEADKDDYLLFIGNILPVKGPHLAIQAAEALGYRLKIAGPTRRAQDYFEQQIEPHLDGQRIEYLGEVNFAQKVALYKHAVALLVPVDLEEPFGMVIIEALACGTPVIAFSRGAIPEIIVDGHVGFLVNDVNEMIVAIKNIKRISPYACREHVERYFSTSFMAEKYVALYHKILTSHSFMSNLPNG